MFQLASIRRELQSVEIDSTKENYSMEAIGLLVTLGARPGKDAEAEAFLKSASAYLVDSARPNILRLKILGSADALVLG
jgi:hypothetical protein